MDSMGATLQRDDVVKVMRGPQRGTTGSIKNAYRQTLFLYNRMVPDNNGVFTIQASVVQLMTGSQPSTFAMPKPPERDQKMGGGRGGGGAGRGFGGRFIDPFVGKTVVVTCPPWKGLLGVVKDALETQYRVELLSMMKIVQVPKEKVKLKQTANTAARAGPISYTAQTPLLGGRTPAHWSGDGSSTPFGGGMTPRHDLSAMTPMRGDRTPGQEIWNPKTPRRDSKPVATPHGASSDDLEAQMEAYIGTSSKPVQTPRVNTPAPTTAAAASSYDTKHRGTAPPTPNTAPPPPQTPVPHTPATSLAPHTPAGLPYTPATPNPNATTSAAAAAAASAPAGPDLSWVIPVRAFSVGAVCGV